MNWILLVILKTHLLLECKFILQPKYTVEQKVAENYEVHKRGEFVLT